MTPSMRSIAWSASGGKHQDFVGASAIAISCIVLPMVFYLKKLWSAVPVYEKVASTLAVLFCLIVGSHVTYKTGKNLFNPDPVAPQAPRFPSCDARHEKAVYYNYTAAHSN